MPNLFPAFALPRLSARSSFTLCFFLPLALRLFLSFLLTLGFPAFAVRTSLFLWLSPQFVPLRPASPLTSRRSFSRQIFIHRQAPQLASSRLLTLVSSLSVLFFRLGSLSPLLRSRLHRSDDFLSLPFPSGTQQHFLAVCSFEPTALPSSCFQALFVPHPTSFEVFSVLSRAQRVILYDIEFSLSSTFLKIFTVWFKIWASKTDVYILRRYQIISFWIFIFHRIYTHTSKFVECLKRNFILLSTIYYNIVSSIKPGL